MLPSGSRPAGLVRHHPGARFVPASYLRARRPASLVSPDLTTLGKRFKRALRSLRRGGRVEVAKAGGVLWARRREVREGGAKVEAESKPIGLVSQPAEAQLSQPGTI